MPISLLIYSLAWFNPDLIRDLISIPKPFFVLSSVSFLVLSLGLGH